MSNDLVGAIFQGTSRFSDNTFLTSPAGIEQIAMTALFTSSGEFKPGLAMKNGGAGDVKTPYANSDTIAEVSGECILNEPISISAISGGQETVKALVAGNVRASKVRDRDGNEVDGAFIDHRDMRDVKFHFNS